MIRAILFDADGVIQTAPNTRSLLKSLITESEQADRFLAEVFAAERPCLTGQKDFAQELQIVLNRWNVRTPIRHALAIWESIQPISEVMSEISNIRKNGISCYLATNQQLLRADYMRSAFNYDILFDGAFYSYEVGAAKPDELYFQRVLSRLPIPSSQVLFIDDNAANIEAARICGMRALQFDATSIDNPVEALCTALSTFGVD